MHKKLTNSLSAVTLMELMVVALIISVLATSATGVFLGQIREARVTAANDLIRQIEVAITRYQTDLGSLPPSGTTVSGLRSDGTGNLYKALAHGMNDNATKTPSSWHGPYLTFQMAQVDSNGNILDPWGGIIRYVQASDYTSQDGSFVGGTKVRPDYAYPDEIYYNPTQYQIYSLGPDGITDSRYPGAPPRSPQGLGADDDISNFMY